MTKTEKIAAIAAFVTALQAQDAKGSTASHAKRADFTVRDFLMVKGVGSTDDVRCRPQGKHDWDLVIVKDGKRICIAGETKVGSGAVRYGKTAEELDFDPDAIYPGVDYVAYCAEPARLKAHPERKGDLFRVFTRDQFIEVLTATGRKGLQSSLRIHQTKSGTWQLEIQPWQTKQTAARLGKYEDWVDANEVPTLEEFREWLRG